MNNIIVIPSLNPDNKLIKLVKELQVANLNNILIVDDGSSSQDIFNQLNDCIIIHHDINKGKGEALKTAFREADKYFKNITGYITCDSDGQHTVEDIKKISDNLKEDIILGVRDFSGKNVPSRSRFGNRFSSLFYYLSTGYKLSDTQTGLRGIPYKYKKLSLETKGSRFEYEMNFLNNVAMNNIKIDTIPIKTIYLNKNKGSNFKTIRDSYFVFKDLFDYIFVALLSFIIDVTLFTIFCKNMVPFTSVVVARIISGTFNFLMNKNVVFKSKAKYSFIKYLSLFIVQMLLSATLVSIFSYLPISKTIIKIVIDLILFIISFFVQRRFIFKKR